MGVSFIHISDVMLGAEPDAGYPWSGERAEELYETFEKIIDIANERGVDFLIIAGNLFSHVPDRAELDRVNEMFGRLRDTYVIYAAGERDYLAPDSAAYSYDFCSCVHLIGGVQETVYSDGSSAVERDSRATMALDRLHFRDKGVCVYGVSYFGRRLPFASDEEFADVSCGDDCELNIFVGCMDKNGREPVNTALLRRAGFSYVALGGRGRYERKYGGLVCCSGSPEPIEPGGTHGYVQGGLAGAELSLSLVPLAKREYKTINYPVGNYTGEMEVCRDIERLLQLEGAGNIFTVNIVRENGCEKSFDISDSLKMYRLLGISGAVFVRSDYEEYERANRNNEFGRLLRRLSEAGLDEREGIKLAVDEMIDLSGIYKRRSRKMSAELYREAAGQALQIFEARRENYENDEAVREYEAVRVQYEVSPDVLDELNETWAKERQTELAIRTMRNKAEELPRIYRRERVKLGMRMALLPVMVAGLLSVILLPMMTGASGQGVASRALLAAVLLVMSAAIIAYCAGYAVTKHFRSGGARTSKGQSAAEAEQLRADMAQLERQLAELHEKRVELQTLDGRKREMRNELTKRESELEEKRYRLKLVKAAIDVIK